MTVLGRRFDANLGTATVALLDPYPSFLQILLTDCTVCLTAPG